MCADSGSFVHGSMPFRNICVRSDAQFCAGCAGMVLGYQTHIMVNAFAAGPEMVRWEVTAVGVHGPYRLGVYHSGGAIVEYFRNVSQALQRERELEDLFTQGRGLASFQPAQIAVGQ
jgi:hypothetical protein